jgi:hypothetical protein
LPVDQRDFDSGGRGHRVAGAYPGPGPYGYPCGYYGPCYPYYGYPAYVGFYGGWGRGYYGHRGFRRY